MLIVILFTALAVMVSPGISDTRCGISARFSAARVGR
jgi:hypothetical protein